MTRGRMQANYHGRSLFVQAYTMSAVSILRVFWPDSEPIDGRGLLFGWASPSSEGTTCVVGTALPENLVDQVLLERVESGEFPAADTLRTDCGALPRFIGELRAAAEDPPSELASKLRRGSTRCWLVMARGARSADGANLPTVVSWTRFSGGKAAPSVEAGIGAANILIRFRRPGPASHAGEYYASRARRAPPLLALGATALCPTPFPRLAGIATIAQPSPALDATLAQINAAAFCVRWVLQQPQHKSPQPQAVACLPLRHVVRLALWPLLLAFLLLRVLASALLFVLDVPILPGGVSLGCSQSALARQTVFKLREFCAWPLLLRALQQRRREVRAGR